MTETFGLVVVRAATREGKVCAFKREMIARLFEFDLDAPFVLHTGVLIAARLSNNVKYTTEYWVWERYRKAQEEKRHVGRSEA